MNEPRKHPLRSLLVAQFLGAFNDNAFKIVVALVALRAATAGLGEAAAEEAAQRETAAAFVIFLLPMLVISLPAGALADRISKRTVIVATKVFEVALMGGAVALLAAEPVHRELSLGLLGAMGLQSGLFSPAKYGILPELVPHERLSAANGALEMWTFMAIVGGTAAGGLLLDSVPAQWMAGAGLLLFSIVGLVFALGVPRVEPARAGGSALRATHDAWRALRGDRSLWLAVLGLSLFWGVASLVGQNVLVYAKLMLGLSDTVAGLPMAAVGIGIGIGSVAAGRLSAGKVELGLVPLGAIGMTIASGAFALTTPGTAGTLIAMAALGAAAGFLLVPLHALMQWRAPPKVRGSVIALSNVLTGGGMLIGTFAGGFLAGVGMSTHEILLGAAIVVLLGTIWALWLLPDAGLRMALVLLGHSVYRLDVAGRERMPTSGGVLLTPNHTAFADGLFLIAALDRRVRFLIHASYYHHPLLHPVLKALGGIPVAASQTQEEILGALRKASEALDRGEVVCIFPEGQITRTGTLLQFRRGLERIASGRDCVIMPVHLDRVWGSIFSRAHGRFFWKRPKRLRYPITVAFGEPLPPDTEANVVRKAVQDLGATAWSMRKRDRTSLHCRAIRMLQRLPWRCAIGDEARSEVSRSALLADAIAMSRALRGRWDGHERVGMALQPGVRAATAALAAAMAGKTLVPLDPRSSASTHASICEQAELRLALTTAETKLPDGVEPVDINDASIPRGGILTRLVAMLAPVAWIERRCGGARSVEDVAAIVFGRDARGEPRGAELTHFNIVSNVEGVAQVFRPEADDRLLWSLPFAHAFGFMQFWLALNCGLEVVCTPDGGDAHAVGRAVKRHGVTVLAATPTQLETYLLGCKPEQFGSLRIAVSVDGPLDDEIADRFEERFGLRPLESYGAVECAPAIAAGVPDFRARGFFQPGSRRGAIGQPLPGVSIVVADPGSREPLPLGEEGVVLVKGPNVMRGYLGRPDETAAAFNRDWFITGDRGTLDDDGFLTITTRAGESQ